MGTELWTRNTDYSHFTQAPGDAIRLQLYNSPVGVRAEGGWSFRDVSLPAPTGSGVSVQNNLPIVVGLAASSATAQLATLHNEDNALLGVALASPAQRVAAPTVAAKAGDASTAIYPAAVAPDADAALRLTSTGLDVGLVLHKPNAGAVFTMSLSLDADASLIQEAGGAIRVAGHEERPCVPQGRGAERQ